MYGSWCQGAGTDAVFYMLDSYKTQKQMGQQMKFSTLSKGLVPICLSGNAPSIAAFFGASDGLEFRPHLHRSNSESRFLCLSMPLLMLSVPNIY